MHNQNKSTFKGFIMNKLVVKKVYAEVYEVLVQNNVSKKIMDQLLPIMLPKVVTDTNIKNDQGVIIAKKCSITNQYHNIDNFYKGSSWLKMFDAQKNNIYALVAEERKKIASLENDFMTDAISADEYKKAKLELLGVIENIQNTKIDISQAPVGFDTKDEYIASLK